MILAIQDVTCGRSPEFINQFHPLSTCHLFSFAISITFEASMFTLTRQIALRRVYSPHLVASLGQRHAGHYAPSRRFSFSSLGGTLALVGAGLSTAFFVERTVHADFPPAQKIIDSRNSDANNATPLSSLVRAYIVYTMCSFPPLVDAAPKLLEVLTSIPVIRNITETFVRVTFFDQFVGGETAQGTLPLLHSFREANKGVLFAYSIEVDANEANASNSPSKKKRQPIHKRCVDEMIRSVDVAADFEDSIVGRHTHDGRRTWVAIKMTALLPDAQSLIALSSHILATRPQAEPSIPFPGCSYPTDLNILDTDSSSRFLNDKDIVSLRELHSDLRRICLRARERGVKLIIDAEYSWYQPAIDAMQLALMREFNKVVSQNDESRPAVQPLIYGTFQAYLRRTPLHLAQSYRDAQANNYKLGVKLVRGAYHPHEVLAHEAVRLHGQHSLSISPDELPPVWTTKSETDRCYDECVKLLVGWVKEDLRRSTSTTSTSLGISIASWFGKKDKLKQSDYPNIGVLFGTHNWSSVKLILNELVTNGLAATENLGNQEEEPTLRLDDEVTERVTLGQLYGMSDELTSYIVRRTHSNSPMVIKYVPYGTLSETIPYLSRRAIENKSVLGDGHASEERARAGREIRTRIFG
ncbi:FAD-linked oxidoreductase-like protein [Lentinula boryana]|uniref:Proline dehydrogenase n=1 Tax=Lentinula boryana TaxID=40481 RepID=A0ABQ8QC81_9AGAR|nr:FAD-linked oxidoreductase-like protein [Lentinula boryana]